ncbi:hypothetical protein [Candidatus Desulfosporosinus nitrosoreducens]|uniref:hypothetical protein n=1 Tax=Candidatus Desulfosporosinus nitrosoreducens TaxID=3401928 RepID=UPI00280C1C2E|nr:hypothetical protein [Desulfosporosinus sp. PR]
MQIGSIPNPIVAMSGKDVFQIGQKIIIEVLSPPDNGKASILVNGKSIQAFLDIEAKPGDKFQVVVKNIVNNTLVLSRDTEVQNPIVAMPDKDTFQIGQKTIIEVLSPPDDGKASILVNGKSVQAFLDIEAKPGDKFQAVVKNVVNSTLVLSRDTEVQNPIVAMPGKDTFQIGQKIIIEVLSPPDDGKVSILVNGESIQAFLDIEAKPGDKFQAVVKNVVNNTLVLSRDAEVQNPIIAMPGKDTFQIGQKIIIEVLSPPNDGKVSILVNGKSVQAFLDIEAKPGDKFQVVVKNLVNNTLVLSRDTEVQNPIVAMPGKDAFQIGQKIIIEVLSPPDDGKVSILVNGESIQAFLDIEAKPGDKLQAVVKNVVNNTLVLSRDAEVQKPIAAMPGKDTFQIGQKIIIEVLSPPDDGKVSILVNGESIQAFLDIEAKPGDKFQAVVKNLADNTLVLSRDTEQKPVESVLSNTLNTVLANRGLPNNELFAYLLNDAQTASYSEILKNTDLPEELLRKFNDLIPSLKGLSNQEATGQIISFLKQLGLNYEHRLFDIFIKGQGGDSEELAQSKDTIKAQLLSLTDTHPSSSVINQFLDKITGQQLWHDTGVDGNGYMLTEIPIRQDQGVRSIKLAIQGSRKNGKIDPKHCRIALQTETPGLGPIGIDAFFSLNQLSLSLLTKKPDALSMLLDGLMTEVKGNFQMIGINLTSIHVKPLDNLEFHTLLKGEAKNGVDVLA